MRSISSLLVFSGKHTLHHQVAQGSRKGALTRQQDLRHAAAPDAPEDLEAPIALDGRQVCVGAPARDRWWRARGAAERGRTRRQHCELRFRRGTRERDLHQTPRTTAA